MAHSLFREFLVARVRQSMMDEDRQAGSKACRFLPPVSIHGCWAHERSQAVDAVGAVTQEQREGLNGISEAHVLSKTGAQPSAGYCAAEIRVIINTSVPAPVFLAPSPW
ncbi:MAG: hypothetical protein QOJ99_4675 [Bryobacterales bacterium]|nr:hypothetical protein [Bryobacterales bacterium]